MKEFIPHTAEQHRTWEWIASDLANWNTGNKVGATPDLLAHEKARFQLKQAFLSVMDYKPSSKPIEEFQSFVDKMVGLSEEQRLDLKLANIKSMQDMYFKKEKTFSVAMNLFSKQKMTELIDFSLALLKEHNIPFRSAITEMLKEQEYEHYVWFCLKYKACEVCGNVGELHHVDQRGSKGYKTDDGRNERVTCLCRKHHSEIHADARAYEKYGIHGIYLTDSMIEKLKLVYPNQFKAYRRVEND
ncbi:hypothetical protein A2U10_01105 [Fusobacterium necrophorum subsp. funduliforme]|uniref:putative HNHc nuclease n=1 Tax=Fusobacterium necrophorum TaxID=859 RepID=UPI000787EB54|nr:putative HNHc nuclease [Fusobacterium necrophorum]KYM40948.1 hypothetical protein A2U10_01105 [Fusobacterium necrophorum subsp. funduliforme]